VPIVTLLLRPRAALVSIAAMTTARTADVVVIGGGVTGTSTAFHLTRRGVRNVIVDDKGAIASGGTGKSSACVRQHYSTAETCRMIRYSLDFFQHFAERVGGESCGFWHTHRL
jgi:glycine/D-amino acid oxidase-like deaminating enzyme